MHQSSSLAPIPSYPEEQLLNDKRRKNLRVMSISITVRDLKKKKKEETDPPPYFREAEIREREESRVAIPPSSPSYSAVAAETLSPEGVKQLLRSGRTFSTSPCFLSKCIVR